MDLEGLGIFGEGIYTNTLINIVGYIYSRFIQNGYAIQMFAKVSKQNFLGIL